MTPSPDIRRCESESRILRSQLSLRLRLPDPERSTVADIGKRTMETTGYSDWAWLARLNEPMLTPEASVIAEPLHAIVATLCVLRSAVLHRFGGVFGGDRGGAAQVGDGAGDRSVS